MNLSNYITRTISAQTVECTIYNQSKRVIAEKTVVIPARNYTEKAREAAIQKQLGPNRKLLHIDDVKVTNELRGMTIADFIANSHRINKETGELIPDVAVCDAEDSNPEI